MTAGAASRVRVLVCEDSLVMREAMTALLAEDPRVEVCGTAEDGLSAVAAARSLRPDVVTMDVEMPGLDGLAAVREIMADAPCRILVVSAVGRDRQQDLSVRAIAAGALEIVPKPVTRSASDLQRWGERLRRAVHLMAEIPVIRRRREAGERPAPVVPSAIAMLPPGPAAAALGIVASTGGPPVLAGLFERLAAPPPFPILCAQHITAGFSEGLARWLAQVARCPVVTATPGAPAEAGVVYLPPDRHHLALGCGSRLVVEPATDDAGPCPSGDRLLTSLAQVLGARAAGVVLTGMGDDGAAGLAAVARAGGATCAQAEASCVVFGMPREALARGGAQSALSPTGISDWIRALSDRR